MEHRFPFQPAIVAMAAIAGVSLLCITILSGCEPSTQKKMAAMPLKGVHVVVADEFWADRPQVKWPPTVLRQTDANGREVYWGLAAAQDLTNALGKVLGRAVPLYRESEASADEGPVVYLGPVRAAAAAGLDAKDMMAGEWRIKCDGKRSFILARTGMGAAYGVTDFLEKFAGYRFLTMDGDDPFTVTPAASVPECDFTAKHCFYERHFSVFDRHLPDTNARWTNRYMRRLGLYISPEAEGHVKPSMCFKGLVHTYTDILPPEKYFASHPEYFTMDMKGNRVNGPRTMLCLSNPEVRRLVTDKFLEAIAKDREENPNDPPIIYDFTQTDGIYYICKCPECRKIAAKYGGDANMDFNMVSEGDSGLQLDFMNDMARKIGAKYPDVRIRTFAYVNTLKLPKGIVPEPNVMPWFCDWYMKSDHQLPLAHPFNSWCREQLEKWKAVSPTMEIYDYMLYDNKYPEVSVDAIAADMRDFKKLGIARFYILSPHRAQCFWQLNTYVYSKFFRDPDTDLEKAIDEYCAVYGAGAAKMREAIDFLRKIIAENPPKSPDLWHKRTLPWRTMENMEKLRGIVREAMSAETRVKPRARMALVLECVDRELAKFYKLIPERAALRKEVLAEWKASAKAVYDGELFAGRDRAGIRKLSEDDLAYTDFKLKQMPDEFNGVPESEIIALDVRSCPWAGQANKKVPDKDSECDLVVRIFPADPAHPLDWAVIRDPEFRQRDTFNVKPTIQNGYRWYRLGVSRIGRAGDCVLVSGLQFALGDFYVECDGMAEDPNWYEFWLSVKYNGDPFSTNEKEGLFVDRLLLRRVKKPHGLDGYSIVRPSALSETDAFVLKDVNGLLARSLGAELPVCTVDSAPSANRIFFGIPPEGFSCTELRDQEKVVVVKGGDVYLFGGGTNGTRYAAYDFLQNSLGFRFFDARGGVAVPDLHKAVLTDGVRRHRFAFEERECRHWVRCAGAESALFFFRHGMNLGIAGMMKRDGAGVAADDYCMPHPNCHSLTRNYLPRESIEDHPEYFSLRNGERIFNSQRCLSNPNVRQLLKKAFFEHLGRVKDPSYIDLSAGDTPWRFCECDGCAALERKYGTNGGPILDVFMEFCPEAARLYPRHRLMTLAYRRSQTQNPPTQVERMPDNFAVRFAPIEDDFSKDWNSPANADTLADLKRWCQVCRKVIMWYYPNPYGYGDMLTPPLGNVERLANDMKIMREAGVTGGTIQHDVGAAPMAGFTELQTYVMARLFDDVALDWRKLADEFIDFEYGAAADGVKKYLAELERLRKETKTFFPWNAGLAHFDYLTPERLVRWGEAFDHMERMVADDRARLRNLRRLRTNLDYATLCSVNKVVAAFPDCAPSPKSLVDRIRAEADEILADCYAKQYAGRAEQFVKWLDEGLFLAEIQSVGNAKPLPMELFGAVPKNRLFVTMPRSSAGGIRDDKSAAYGKAAVYDAAGKPEATGLPFVANFGTRMPRSDRVLGIGRGVDTGNIAPSGEYRFYEMGTVELTRDCFVELGVRNLRATLNSAYVEGEYNKAKIYASLKFQGPAFYPADTNSQNKVWCDRIVVVRE